MSDRLLTNSWLRLILNWEGVRKMTEPEPAPVGPARPLDHGETRCVPQPFDDVGIPSALLRRGIALERITLGGTWLESLCWRRPRLRHGRSPSRALGWTAWWKSAQAPSCS